MVAGSPRRPLRRVGLAATLCACPPATRLPRTAVRTISASESPLIYHETHPRRFLLGQRGIATGSAAIGGNLGLRSRRRPTAAGFQKARTRRGKVADRGNRHRLPAERCPSLRATPAEHLEDFRRKLDDALSLEPIRITALTGADFWDFPLHAVFSARFWKSPVRQPPGFVWKPTAPGRPSIRSKPLASSPSCRNFRSPSTSRTGASSANGRRRNP